MKQDCTTCVHETETIITQNKTTWKPHNKEPCNSCYFIKVRNKWVAK